METVIRLAIPADLEDIRRIARLAYALYVPRIGREPAPMVADFSASIASGNLWAATRPVEGPQVMGFAVAYPGTASSGGCWFLENVAVDPAATGTGLGGQLIAHVEAMARAAGAPAIELYTNAKMTENQTLYPWLGYTEIDRRTEDGFDRVFYRKDLA